MTTPIAATVFRKYVTDGVPGSGANQVSKADASAWGTWLESLLGGSAQGLAYSTSALLSADLAHPAATTAIVYGDATAALNGLYVKTGAAGSGSWSRIGDLPNAIVRLTVTSGTGDAIVATAPETPSVPGSKLYLLTPTANNTTATTIVVNGQPAVPIKNAFGVDLANGSLIANSQVLMAWSVDHYQLLISAVVDGNAILANCTSAASSASASATSAAANASALGNQVHQYDTRALAVGATIPAGVNLVRLLGFYAAGDGGGALYKRVGALTSGWIGFQSADGAWWQISERVVSTAMAGARGDGSTDDTVVVQAAATSTPTGGTLRIQESNLYSPTGQYIGGCLVKSTIVVDHPIDIEGGGMYSNLKPDVTFSPSQPVLLIQENATYWFGITFRNFAIGNDPTAVPYTRYGGIGIQIYSAGLSIPRMRFENLHIGESGNDYSFWIDGVGTQQCIWRGNLIAGGLYLNNTADSHIIKDNVFAGRSSKGVLINMPGTGGLQFSGNTVTAVGGVVIQGNTSKAVVADNYLEELAGFPFSNAPLTDGTHTAMLALTGAIVATTIRDNLFNMGQSASPAHPLFISSTAINPNLIGNQFNNSNNGNSGSIYSGCTTLIGGPNYYLQSVHLVGGGAWALNYGGN